MISDAPQPKKRRFRHLPELDGVRAIAVSLVFIGHIGLGHIVPGGLGVTIFFFLSGYLITSLIIDEYWTTGSFSLKAFYIRRCLRILPPMWLSMFFAIALSLFGFIATRFEWGAVVAQLVFLTNYSDLWGSQLGAPGIPLWSLAVEEHFYFLFPVIFTFFLFRNSLKFIALGCILLLAFFLLLRVASYFMLEDTSIIYYRSHLRMDSILFGCVLAIWRNPILEPEESWRPGYVAMALAGIAMALTLVVRNDVFRETLRYTIQGAALYVIYSFILTRRTLLNAFLNSSPLQVLGRYSYEIYLVHMPVVLLIDNNLSGLTGIPRALLAATMTLVLSAAIHEALKSPILILRKRFLARPQKNDAVELVS